MEWVSPNLPKQLIKRSNKMKTFTYKMGSDKKNWLIVVKSNQHGYYAEPFYLLTEGEILFNFKTEAEAKNFVDKLNAIADTAEHQNK